MLNEIIFGSGTGMRFPRLGKSLHAVYFADDGDDAEKEAAAKAAKEAEWDAARQHKDELNAAKKRQEESDAALSDANAELEAAATKLAEMEAEKLVLQEEAEKKATDADADETEKGLLDYNNMIAEVTAQKKLISDLTSKQTAQAAEIAVNQKTNEALDAQIKNEARDREGNAIINKLCAELEKDKKFSAGDRNTVLEECNKAYKDGKISTLGNDARQKWIKDHLRLGYMDKAEERAKYEKLSDSDKRKQRGVKVDSGVGGDPPTDDIKPGTGPEVKKQMVARAKRLQAAGGE